MAEDRETVNPKTAWGLLRDSERQLRLVAAMNPSTLRTATNEAERHTRKATTPALKELWAKVTNEALERTGDEGRAIREANAVIARQAEHGH